MRSFSDEAGAAWLASAREEDTPRHHGRWYLVFQAEGSDAVLPMPEVRWQTRATAQRTLQAMSRFELLRRLHIVLGREAATGVVPPERQRTSASAG